MRVQLMKKIEVKNLAALSFTTVSSTSFYTAHTLLQFQCMITVYTVGTVQRIYCAVYICFSFQQYRPKNVHILYNVLYINKEG